MFLLLLFLSVFCASIPMLTFLVLIWWLDRNDREPVWLFGLTFLWGVIGSIFMALVGSEVMMQPLAWVLGPDTAEQWSAVLVAPIIEEPSKAAILFAVMFSRHFDNAADGFVYGAAAGLGFAMTENFLYFADLASYGDVSVWMATVVIRTFFSAVMHACATSCVGAALGWARFRGIIPKIVCVPLGFGCAIGMHMLWNGMLTMSDVAGMPALTSLNFVLFIGEFLVIFAVFQLALWDERATIRKELADEVNLGTLPLVHASHIASTFKRGGQHWLPRGVPHWPYVRAVVSLALRKHQSRNSTGSSHAFFADEVLRLRAEVKGLQGLAKG
ncbi:MAG: PrsW family intramembrane metalloprotease [Myxococcales bacterium]|nr:PrsW family intramembrane metalloprotease [Myxococcales bacterium]